MPSLGRTVVAVVAMWLHFGQAVDFSCTVPAAFPNAPPLPTVMAGIQSYQAQVEITLQEKNITMVTEEYLDGTSNRGVVFTYRQHKKIQEIFSFATDEILRVDPDAKSCLVTNLSAEVSTSIFGSIQPGADKKRLFGSAAALRFAADSNIVYVGTRTARGVPANVWAGCIDSPNARGKVKVTYYFSRPGWSMPSATLLAPLKLEVEGLSLLPLTATPTSPPAPSTGWYFHHVYQFINFQPTVGDDWLVFQVPEEVICVNRTNTRTLPKFPGVFTYRAEIIHPGSSLVTHYSIWYNQDSKLVREDSRTSNPGPHVNTKDPVTEIHDFNTAVRHVMDQNGGCSSFPIDLNAADSKEDIARFQYNKSIVVDIRDPSSFFQFNDNYKYAGQKMVRGFLCDAFSAIIPGFKVDGQKVDAKFEFYFLSDSWKDVPLNGLETSNRDYPVQLVVYAPVVDYTRVYNFFDFAENFIMADIFDATPCSKYENRIRIQLTFPGDFNPANMEQWKQIVYYELAEVMHVSPLRLSRIFIESDGNNVYVSFWLLDTQNYAQFQQSDKSTFEHQDDKVIFQVTSPLDCADLCVNNEEFQCNAFEYCIYNRYACRLLKDHLPTTPLIANATECVFSTRPIAGNAIKEPTVSVAYSTLEQAVHGKKFTVDIPDDQNKISSYTAISVEILSGKPIGSKPLPSLPLQFSNRIETVMSKFNKVSETFVWYDGVSDLVRYDTRNPASQDPYMITYIHDFKYGVSYKIDRQQETCDISPISLNAFDIVSGKPQQDGSLILFMKSPQSLLYLDDSYRYYGQKNVRGILCDLFESTRTDFNLEAYNMSSQESIFRYYFQSDGWDYVVPDGTDSTHNKPVMLQVEDKSAQTSLTFNFFDFADQFHPISYFDTSLCYDPQQKHTFIIIFKNQSYHPVLDQAANSFINSSVNLLALLTNISRLQFQQISLTYDETSVYLKVTALGTITPIALFEPGPSLQPNPPITNERPEDCAAMCVGTMSQCRSFDWCVDPTGTFCLYDGAKPDAQTAHPNSNCTHYTRSDDNIFPSLDITAIYNIISNNVYNGQFKIKVTLLDLQISEMISLSQVTLTLQELNSVLQKFVTYTDSVYSDWLVNETFTGLSVTDCAYMCLQENVFDCASFEFSFTTERCRLSSGYPDQKRDGSVYNKTKNVNIYAKLYTKDYTKYPGEVFTTVADKVLSNVRTDESCARECTSNLNFQCESFEICYDGTCKIRKTHLIQTKPKDVMNSSGCTHYSRNHLYDYVERQQKTIDDPDGSLADVTRVTECADLCSTGEGQPACASFTVCNYERGVQKCTLSRLDPTVNKSVVILDDIQCTLYTKINNQMPLINPFVSDVTASSSVLSKPISTTTSPGTTQSTVSNMATNKISRNLIIQENTKSCLHSSSSSATDTSVRIGIAFGTLVLGLLVGGLASFLYYKFHTSVPNLLRET
ncbi:uncharacterized protein LOC131952325 [Physella acuta]|uniref:uncharacterized protein LOC131952325 n=1 Tax=Physella acuta TaxID=109671 RepID=UPI0027DB9BA6|nr:uncharacterized protein LOC131952325 [Physella acuta]